MSELYDKVVQGWPVIQAAPWTFVAILVPYTALMALFIWKALNWAYSSRLHSRDDQIKNLDGEITLLQRQRDDYKDKLGGASPDEAKDSFDQLTRKLDIMSDQVAILANKAAIQCAKSPEPDHVDRQIISLSQLSNAALRTRSAIYASSMRGFESEVNKKRMELILRDFARAPISDGEKQIVWNNRTNALIESSMDAQNEFRLRFLPEALALEKELTRRIGRRPREDVIALRHGMLAGSSPVTDAANYIEALARDLPS